MTNIVNTCVFIHNMAVEEWPKTFLASRAVRPKIKG